MYFEIVLDKIQSFILIRFYSHDGHKRYFQNLMFELKWEKSHISENNAICFLFTVESNWLKNANQPTDRHSKQTIIFHSIFKYAYTFIQSHTHTEIAIVLNSSTMIVGILNKCFCFGLFARQQPKLIDMIFEHFHFFKAPNDVFGHLWIG